MRIIKPQRIREYARRFPDARGALTAWLQVAQSAVWRSLPEVRRTFPTADGVRVASGRVATVFNIRGNNYRLITAIHYNRSIVYVMRFLTHAEYDAQRWKDEL